MGSLRVGGGPADSRVGREMRDGPEKSHRLRIIFILVTFYLGLGVVSLRTYQLQVLKAAQLKSIAQHQYLKKTALRYPRGVIYDRNLEELAVTKKSYSLYAYTKKVKDPRQVSKRLARLLEMSPQAIEKILKDPEPFVWIARPVSEEQGEAVLSLEIPGIGAQPDESRYYPGGGLAGQVLGFAGVDCQGLEGVEQVYDKQLKGKPVFLTMEKDARDEIRMFVDEDIQADRPASLALTLDQALQHLAEQKLKETVTKWNARRGCLIAIEPDSGAILAMALYPAFNPNYFYAYQASDWRNWALVDIYEPGSTFKVFVMASALEERKVSLDDKINCENGSYVVAGDTINDMKGYGELTVPQVLSYSSNIGMAKVAEKLGPALLYQHLLEFGFGSKTGIGFPGERSGYVRPYKKWYPITLRTIGFGQGVSVTPIQMVAALSSIANGGELVQPYLAEKLIYPDGTERVLQRRTVNARVLSPAIAREMTELMVGVVNSGTGRNAQIPGYQVAGKTGTAQKPRRMEEGGGYYPDKWVCSFMGFAPADRPKIAMIVIIDEPQADLATGGMIAAPVFQEVTKYALTTLGELPEASPSSGLKTALINNLSNPQPMSWENTRINPSPEPGKIPDLQGMALADAMKMAFQLGQNPVMEGSGWVVGQDPAPGDPLSGRVTLKLSQERQ